MRKFENRMLNEQKVSGIAIVFERKHQKYSQHQSGTIVHICMLYYLYLFSWSFSIFMVQNGFPGIKPQLITLLLRGRRIYLKMAWQLFLCNFESGICVLHQNACHLYISKLLNPENPVYRLTLLKLIRDKIIYSCF